MKDKQSKRKMVKEMAQRNSVYHEQQKKYKEQNDMISEKRRLLTTGERNYIYEMFKKNNRFGNYLKWFVIVMIPMSLMSIILGIVYSIFVGFICMTVGCIVAVNIFVWGDKTMKKLISQIEADELYVREAIFKGINKYHQATFYVKNNGRLELYFKRVDIKNRVVLEDKVILIERGKVDWVYKARE